MKPVRQLFRQPMKTLAGMILMALAAAILILCVGQALVASRFQAALEETFTTIALPTEIYQYSDDSIYLENTIPEEVSQWMEALAAQYPDVVKAVASPGLASAYIRELKPDNYTRHLPVTSGDSNIYYYLTQQPLGAPYSCAMLEITLTEVGQTVQRSEEGYVMLTGIIESVIGLEEGFADPTGFQANLYLFLPDISAVDSLELSVGQRYLVYSMDYCDSDWALRSSKCVDPETGMMLIDAFDPERLEYFSDETIASYRQSNPSEYYVAQYRDPEAGISFLLTNQWMKSFRGISMILKDESVMPENQGIEGIENYQTPTIVRLEGSTEDFLSSEEGKLWQEALDNMEINNHAFAVIGVDRLAHIADFARGNAEITVGRDFSAEELESGAKVCILSETVAKASGLSVGDVIEPLFYEYDENSPYQDPLAEGNGVINPGASFFTSVTSFAPETEKYIIIGLYSQKNAWCGLADNPYSFTPNTIFVPKASVPVAMQYANQGFFGALELYNGTITAFNEILDQAGHSLLYVCYDQGYSIVKENMHDYVQLAAKAMVAGMVMYSIILFLYLVLFPARQGKAVRQMGVMGAEWWRKMGYMMSSGLGILLPGTIVGTVSAALLWNRTVTVLASVLAADLTLKLDWGILITLAGTQMAAALVLTMMVSLPMVFCKHPNRR